VVLVFLLAEFPERVIGTGPLGVSEEKEEEKGE